MSLAKIELRAWRWSRVAVMGLLATTAGCLLLKNPSQFGCRYGTGYFAYRSLRNLPDGTPSSANNLWIENLDGTDAKPLTRNTASSTLGVMGVSMSPDGQTIAFASNMPLSAESGTWNGTAIVQLGGTGATNVWVIRSDGTGLRAVTRNTTDSIYGTSGVLTFSPDSKYLYFDSNTALDGSWNSAADNVNVWRVNIIGVNLPEPLTQAPATCSGCGSSWAVVSPDGSRVAFSSYLSLTESGTYVTAGTGAKNAWLMNADGTGLTPLTRNTGSATYNVNMGYFSSDGQTYFFPSFSAIDGSWNGTASASYNVFRIGVDGDGNVALTQNSAVGLDSIAGSRILTDDGWLYFNSKTALDGTWNGTAPGSFNIWKMRTDGSQRTPVTRNTLAGLNTLAINFTPDEQRILVRTYATGTTPDSTASLSENVALMTFNGSTMTFLTYFTAAGLSSVVGTPGPVAYQPLDCSTRDRNSTY